VIGHPDVLIYLDVSYAVAMERRRMDWTSADHAEQIRRLAHAREHCDLYVDTNDLTIEAVRERVLQFLRRPEGD
jgi:hypothetical protein